jgi:hypothetical protein
MAKGHTVEVPSGILDFSRCVFVLFHKYRIVLQLIG